MVEMLRTKTNVPGITFTAAPVEFVTPELRGLRIFGQPDKLKANRSEGA